MQFAGFGWGVVSRLYHAPVPQECLRAGKIIGGWRRSAISERGDCRQDFDGRAYRDQSLASDRVMLGASAGRDADDGGGSADVAGG